MCQFDRAGFSLCRTNSAEPHTRLVSAHRVGSYSYVQRLHAVEHQRGLWYENNQYRIPTLYTDLYSLKTN
jgi:hypothetical protein